MKWQNLALPIVTAITVASLQAQTPDASPSASPGLKHHWAAHHGWIWRKLNLTDAQKQQIRTIWQNNRKNPAFRSALATFLQAKQKMQADVKANQTVPPQDASALGAAEAQLAVVRAQQQNEIKAVLTPDQLQTWNEFQAKRESFLQKRIEKLTSQPDS
jgi:Spy/CpxP family protein refolding chaperone